MRVNRYISKYSLFLMLGGLAVNILGVKAALYFGLPLFLDSIGTILASALGGGLPGVVVGFLSNLINGVSDPITLYYGIVSVLIAIAAAFFAERGWFRTFGKSMLTVPFFAFFGGVIGSVITWLLYGFSFGTGISAPYAVLFAEKLGMRDFYAQLSADILIDVADKLLAVIVVYAVLKLLPDALKGKFALGRLYTKAGAEGTEEKKFYRRWSLRGEMVVMIVVTSIVLGTLATSISFVIYKDTMEERYIEYATSAVELMLLDVDGDSVERYMKEGPEAEGYAEARAGLQLLNDTLDNIEYVYVYQIKADGCHVVFDTDTPETPASSLGDVVGTEAAFAPYYDALLAGEEIEPVISNGYYGWLLTVYTPVRNSAGVTVAYAAADVDMNEVITDRYVFIIKMASLLFGAAMIIVVCAVWFTERRMVGPINAMTAASQEFAFENEDDRLKSIQSFRELRVDTGDELENLHLALIKTVEDVGRYIGDINKKNQVITAMQRSMVISFAEMVESRDECTGEHVKHTSGYVRCIAEEMKKEGVDPELLTDGYIDNLARSAPLHDIGKIKISDTLLNKPGRLTPEEFEVMKTHAAAGREILENTMRMMNNDEYLAAAKDMAAYHHERWDGTGYPEGLAGEQIPLPARIMAVADVFDALISKRSYKEAMSFDDAVRVIREESGTHFDPEVVEAFIQSLEEIRKLSGS